jgi:hypothetical protein
MKKNTQDIQNAARDAVRAIAAATADAAKLIAASAAEARTLVTSNAVEAAKVLVKDTAKNDSDHDLIQKLDVKFDNLKVTVDRIEASQKEQYDKAISRSEFKEVTDFQQDHEKRIRVLEEVVADVATIKKLVYGAVATILLSVLSAIIYLAIHH